MSGGQWTLRTARTRYVISLTEDGRNVLLDHWGPDIGEVPRYAQPDRLVGHVTEVDVLPLEYASAGQRHTAFSELRVERADFGTGAIWSFDSTATVSEAADGDELVLSAVDESGALQLQLRYRTSGAHDVVTRSITISNGGADAVTLPRAFSAGWNLPVGQRVRLDYLAGSWAREFQRRSIDLSWGTFSIGSRDGITGLRFSPVVAVTGLDDGEHAPRAGTAPAYGVALAWSGSWRINVDAGAVGEHVRVSAGIDEDTTTVTLLSGESFTAPESLGVYAADGADALPGLWHEYQRTLRREVHRPVVYNSWMATEFDVNVAQQAELARLAAALGVETFVVDDGWFLGRDDDRGGLGDWSPDPRKFPDGLTGLTDIVSELGMDFGLWVEPEAVSPASRLYAEHPDWIYRADGRPLLTVRNQYVLDLGRDEVVGWIEHTLRELLRSAPIRYLKWDMNRTVSDGGRPGDPHGREWAVQHARGYHRVMRMLRTEFPDVIVEACASGGGRIDNAVLALSDVVWPSDQVGARDRLVIQDGFLRAYPAWAMSSWVTDDPGHRDRRPVSLGYRFAVAMAGVLGIGSDLQGWSAQEHEEARRMIAVHKDIGRVVQDGTVRTVGSPHDDLYTVVFRGPEDDPRVVVLVFDSDRDRSRDRETPRVHPAGLDPDRVYRVEQTGERVTAASATALGVRVPFAWAADAEVLVLTPVG
ncbi:MULTISPECIES: alpha-galactosidase [unclassified Microbacterium]|uniref:alpha-galactosidase n=1 Tax=unclassified Microbacterium TaxID=2609290 RepID=UPI0012F88F72|nr:alpha-galactosidase [Microbacterium sp. MAH-37]MVQ43704.1 alpha-galactosidase [Microbacterium sp. MAH-37]